MKTYNFFKIPLTTDPNQTFSVVVPINSVNKPLILNIKYNGIAGYWLMSITDKISGNLLIDSLPLITGIYPSGDLLGQYGYLELGSWFIIKKGTVTNDYPDNTDLGSDFLLIAGDRV